MKSLRGTIVAGSFLLPLVPFAVASCKHDAPTADTGKGGRAGGRGMGGEGGVMFAVDTLKVQSQKLNYVVEAPGTLDAFERVQVTSRVAGAVDRVAFREGQTVKQGDILVVIDSERYRVAMNSAQAALEKSKAAQSDMEAMVARREGASEQHPGLIPGEELASYKTKVLTAKADTAVSQEGVRNAELNLRDSAVRAPMAGVIQTRTVETGQYVNTGYVMATLLQNDPMLLRFNVDPSEAPRLKPDMVAKFTMRETDNTYEAKLTLVAGSADATTHMVPITAQVANTDKKYWLRPGAFCDVSVDIGATRDSPIIPRSAMRATDHGYVTYVVDGNVAQERAITLGMNTKDGWVEVRTGLSAGDAIVVHGADALSNGAHVRATLLASLDASAPPPGSSFQPATGAGPAGSGEHPRGDGGAHKKAPQ